jgi:large subunit ribosomal protein L21
MPGDACRTAGLLLSGSVPVYAVVRTGGKQYRVQEGRPITIERLPGAAGETIELNDVLLLADGENVTVGNPVIEGARVVGTIAEQGRTKKIIVFRFKAKTRARKKNGHRQAFTRFMVEDILAPGQAPKVKQVAAPETESAAVEDAPKPRRRAKAATTEAALPTDAPADEEATVEAPAATEKPKRAPRKKAE